MNLVSTTGEISTVSRWKKISHEMVKTGYGRGIRSSYRALDGKEDSYAFDTYCWIEETGEGPEEGCVGKVHFEWIPICEKGLSVKEVRWPVPMAFSQDTAGEKWYTLINEGQGLLLPNSWGNPVNALSFRGQFLTAGGYMPWFGQVKQEQGYIAIADTPWNAGAYVDHPAGGPYTHIGIWWEPSLGKMDYRRSATYVFLNDCDHNDLCRIYRIYAKQTGKLDVFISLRNIIIVAVIVSTLYTVLFSYLIMFKKIDSLWKYQWFFNDGVWTSSYLLLVAVIMVSLLGCVSDLVVFVGSQ